MSDKVEIIVTATDEASKTLREIGNVAGGLGNVLGGAFKVGLAGAAVGLGALGAGVAKSIGEAMNAEKTQAQLAAVLKSTKGAAGMTADAINDLADSLSGMTTFEDEAIIGAQSMLLTFTNIGKEVFPDATETVLDMSQALGQDLKSSSVMLGKALNDPIQGVSALQRVGVSFTDAQKEQIKTLVESGRTMDAQKIILKELQTEFGGSAKAAGETFGGQMQILQNQIGNVMEDIGKQFLPALKELVAWVNKEILPAFKAWANDVSPKIQAALKQVSDWVRTNVLPVLREFQQFIKQNVAPALLEIGKFIQQNVVPALNQFAGFIKQNVVPAIKEYVLPVLKQLGEWIGSNLPPLLAALQPIWENVLKPALQGLGDILGWLFKNAPAAGDALGKMWTEIQTSLSEAWSVIEPILKSVTDELSKFWTEIQPKLAAAWENISAKAQEVWTFINDNIIQPIVSAIQQFLTEHGEQIKAILQGVWDEIQGAVKVAWELIQGIVKIALDLLGGDFDAAGRDWNAMMEGVWDGIKQIFRGALAILSNIVVIALQEILSAINGKMQEVSGALHSIWDGVRTFFANLPGQLFETGKNIVQGLIDGFWDQADAIRRALNEIVQGAIDAIKQRLGIRSPSQVFAEMGVNMARGLMEGFAQPQLNFAPVMLGAAQSAQSDMMNLGATAMSGRGALMSGASAGGRGGETIIVQLTYAPTFSLADERELTDRLQPFIERGILNARSRQVGASR